MNPGTNPSASAAAENREPAADQRTVPIWLFILLFVMLYYGMVYFDQHGGWFSEDVYAPYKSFAEVTEYQPKVEDGGYARGKVVYENICALCHNPDGAGKPGQAPPLAGSEWAQGSPARMIRIPLVGFSGSVKVKGQEYNLSMAAMGAALSDDDLAAVLTYIRMSFGNKGSIIKPEQVKAVRAEVGNRTQPWSEAELLAVP
jgi:mono/diheme cytochrome c family protein